MKERQTPGILKPGLENVEDWTIADQDGSKHPSPYFSYPRDERSDIRDKVVRWEEICPETIEALPYVRDLLTELEDIYHIPTVHTQFAVSDGEFDSLVSLIQMSDRIADARPTHDTLPLAAGDEDVAKEFDALSCRMIAHMRDVVTYGGVYESDYYRYDQFVYSPNAIVGQKLILVDTEPIFVVVEPKPIDRSPASVPAQALGILMGITQDIIRLEKTTQRPSYAGADVRKLVESIDPGNQYPFAQACRSIIIALDHHDTTLCGYLHDPGLDGSKTSEELVREEEDRDELDTGLLAVSDSTMSIRRYIERRKAKGLQPYQPFRDD